MHRFFVSPKTLDTQPVALTGEQAFQIRRVLRMRLGERATLLDNRGWAYESILIAYGEADVKFQVVRRWAAGGEPRTHFTLFQAVLKGARFGWALQKGTEVGISRFVPMICDRNVVDDSDAVGQKRERWERIIQEAAEQSGRARLPELAAVQLFGVAVQPGPDPRGGCPMPAGPAASLSGSRDFASAPLRLVLWQEEHANKLRSALASCNLDAGACIELFVGPEGGFTPDEVRLAQRYGVQPVTLGPRILRAETAGVVAVSAILYEAGEI